MALYGPGQQSRPSMSRTLQQGRIAESMSQFDRVSPEVPFRLKHWYGDCCRTIPKTADYPADVEEW